MVSSLPVLSNSFWATGKLKTASVAPPSEETLPNLAIPAMRNFCSAERASAPIVSPIL